MANRREFFATFKKPLTKPKDEAVIRPPYGLNESFFLSECTKCLDKECATYCEEKIIVIKSDGTPTLNLTKGGCTFCEECAKACKKGVLSLDHLHSKDIINAKFSIIIEACMAHNKIICFSCKEPCLDDAILFNGMFNPVIDTDRCTGCGFCISRCPTNAIVFEPISIKEQNNEY